MYPEAFNFNLLWCLRSSPRQVLHGVPGSDVKAHSEIDLDQKAMEAALGANNFTGAAHWYANGEGSFGVIHPGGAPPPPP